MPAGRPGVGKETIRAAIAELEREGQMVTVRAVRERTGGSNTTILEEIHLWRADRASRQRVTAAEEDRALPPLPETLTSKYQNLMAEVWREAIAAIEAENRLLRQQLEAENRSLRQQLADMAARYELLEKENCEEVGTLLNEVGVLGAQKEELQAALSKFQAELETSRLSGDGVDTLRADLQAVKAAVSILLEVTLGGDAEPVSEESVEEPVEEAPVSEESAESAPMEGPVEEAPVSEESAPKTKGKSRRHRRELY